MSSASFGPNAWLVEEMYEQYQRRPRVGRSELAGVLRQLPPVDGAAAIGGRARRRRAGGARREGRRCARRQRLGHPCRTGSAGRRRRRGRGDQRGRRPDRHQHGGQPRGADGDLGAARPRQAARAQPPDPQQPPGAPSRRQGQLHPPDRVRGGAGPPRVPRDERRIRRRRRRQADGRPPRVRQPGHRRGRRERRRVAQPRRPRHQGCRPDGLPRVLDHLRGAHPQGADQEAVGGRPARRHGQPDQPGDARHGALRPPPHGRPGRDRRASVRSSTPSSSRRPTRRSPRSSGSRR